LVKIFFNFFQTLARFGHPKVENFVQDKVSFKSRLLKCGYFFFEISPIYELDQSAKISMSSSKDFSPKIPKILQKNTLLYEI
jgi:hypothetical protein